MGKISFTDATEALQDYLDLRGRSPLTKRAYLTDIRMMWEEMELGVIDLADLEKIAAAWLTSKRRILAAKSTGRRLTSAKCLGLALKNPILADYNAPTPPAMEPHPLPGGQEDLKKLLASAGCEEEEILVTLLGLCGERVSESLKTVPSHFDMREQKIHIFGKGDKERIVPVSNYAWSILLPVIVRMTLDGQANKPMIMIGDRAARATITKLGVRAGISRPISSHDLRATFATAAYERTKDIRAVQYLLGHASVTQTQQYVASLMNAQRAAANFMEDED